MSLFIVFPWAATRLWNSRWNAMSFGPLEFRADLDARGPEGALGAGLHRADLAMLASAVAAIIASTAKLGGREADPEKMAGLGVIRRVHRGALLHRHPADDPSLVREILSARRRTQRASASSSSGSTRRRGSGSSCSSAISRWRSSRSGSASPTGAIATGRSWSATPGSRQRRHFDHDPVDRCRAEGGRRLRRRVRHRRDLILRGGDSLRRRDRLSAFGAGRGA